MSSSACSIIITVSLFSVNKERCVFLYSTDVDKFETTAKQNVGDERDFTKIY